MVALRGRVITLSVMVLAISVLPVYGQITTACTTSMISSFTPCMNFITGSTGNGSSTPTADCCNSLKSLLGTSMDCACLIITGSVPVQLPINRTLAISLPRACKMGGVPVQCKASGTPLPAPGPVSFGSGSSAPSPSPLSSSPTASFVPQSTSPAPEPDTTSLTTPPASPPLNSETPTSIPGRRPVLTPTSSASKQLSRISSTYLPFVLVVMVVKYY
ncbi:Bifunctional inhibitor/plant lipid transfer protein/seed storage helical domain [Macleaya cordata]|uniref:Bifunctional inhibitor/plant lipid transfer protein/seed storage helical domain n=1 Tax=Macleaya cordata TaxID=56857 RepID=A0A200Q4V7_MACCD|nr:Bifunctional inhibitor/plant lipid transfer protein/seed storage helical domain [Macleaya cordata]